MYFMLLGKKMGQLGLFSLYFIKTELKFSLKGACQKYPNIDLGIEFCNYAIFRARISEPVFLLNLSNKLKCICLL